MIEDTHSEGQLVKVDHEKYKEGNIDTKNFISDFERGFNFKKPLTTLKWGGNDGSRFELNVDKKFNWFQKKMLKIFFGFEVKENK